MRWGVREQSADDHTTVDLCLKELKACQQLSTGPNFVTFLGQKYGFRPFPPRIPGDEFLQIAAALENEHDRSLIEKWFKCDFNAVPPAYMLQPISSCLPDYLSHDRDKRSKAWEEWQLVFGRLQHVLRGAARHVLKDDEQIHKYFMSVTESEIRQGILASADPARECCWFSRNIRDLEKHVADGRAHLFIDTTREGDVDLEAQRLLGNLKKDLLHCYLPLDNVKTYDVTWSRDGISPNLNNEHRAYIERMCEDVQIVLQHLITNAIERRNSSEVTDPMFEEALQHLSFCQSKCEQFYGREDVLLSCRLILSVNKVWYEEDGEKHCAENGSTPTGRKTLGKKSVHTNRAFIIDKGTADTKNHNKSTSQGKEVKSNSLRSPGKSKVHPKENSSPVVEERPALQVSGEDMRSYDVLDVCRNRPLVIYGESGCGKTSVVSMVAMRSREWLRGDTCVVVRYIGTTPDSSLVRLLVRSVCQQICAVYEKDPSFIRNDIKELKEDFIRCLRMATVERPLLIVLDSLDQLSAEDGARQLSWLPMTLPDHVHLVVSTIPEVKYECFPVLKAFLPPESFVLVPKLPQKDAAEILVSYLRMEHRTLSTDQQDIVQQALQECSLPIFVRVAFDEAIRWKSYSPLDETVLQHTVRGAINSLFERVERQHGHVLVSRALGYVTAAKSGLTETELEDLLSCDDFVLDDVYQYWTPPVRRIPPLLWVRIRQDLESYLVTRGADGAQVVTWYHRQFIEAAQARYLNKKNETLQLHHNLSDYFLGRYSNGIRKPYTTPEGRETAADRLVAPQPLVFESTTGKPKYNYRKLNELPYHLVHAQELETSKDCVLCNFEFLLTSLEASSLRDVLDYFDLALTQWPEDQDITLVKETLQLSAYALTQYPAQLPSQLLGRIQKCDSRHLTTLLHQATRCSRASLVPSTCCLTSPGGPMVHALTGQTRSSTAMTASDDGSLVVSASSDNSVNLWNVATGRLVRSIEKAGENISSVLVAKDNTLIVSTCPGCVSAWRVSTGQRIFRIDTNGDCAPITTVTHGNESHLVTVVASSIRIIDLETGAIIQEFRDEKLRPEIGAHMTMGTTGSRLLYTGLRLEEDSGRLIRALDLKSGYISTVLRLDESVTSMEDLIGITADGSLLLSKSRGGNQRQRTQSAGQALTFILELWSLEKQSRMRTICNHGDRVRCFSLSSDKKNLIALCDSRFQDSTNVFRGKVKIVDLASGDSTDSYLSYPSNINFISYIDGNHFISSSNDKLLRIWDLKRNQASTENPTEVEIYEREIVSSRDDLVTFNGSGMTGILNAHTGSEIRFVNGSTPQMLIVDVARVIIADDDKMFLYDLENRAKVLDFAGATRPDNLRCFFVCKQSLLVCIAQDRKSMDVYDVVSGNKLSHLMAQSGDTEIAWFSHSSDGRYCVTAHAPESKPTLIYGYTVWNVESSALVQTLVFDMEQFIEFQDLEISHDGNYVMHIVCTANSRLYQARIYDVTSGNVLHCPETEVHVHEASFTEDAAFFLLGLMDGSLQLYDITSGLLLFSLRAHSGAIHRIFTSETVNVVMTTAGGLDSKDRSVRLWKISDQRISQLTVFTPDAKISSLVFTFGGRAVAMEITDIVTFQLVDQDTFVSCDVTHSNDAIRGSFVVDLKEL
ncbi:NACHT domain- and WD repeat-containing protein 1 isoform X2 [Nematostella vectensis]|uniref:NACHT domain- and WD repeat-containing protein 1 isoform X2 n=1 Tax=Nematostella vectensis TaxID=45351 RepID=UPI0020770E3B|nr:NACHT domain- and WD repeat-containing protein 1 isoform X2 [Nematostella vectensis]